MKRLILITNLLLICTNLVFAEDVRVKTENKYDHDYTATCPICNTLATFHNGTFLYYFENTECEHIKYFMVDVKGKRYIVFGETEEQKLREKIKELEINIEHLKTQKNGILWQTYDGISRQAIQ